MLRRQLVDLEWLEARYSISGFSYAERDKLNWRLPAVRRDMRIADNGGWDRYDRYANDDRWGRYAGRGGPYEDVICERPGGRQPRGQTASWRPGRYRRGPAPQLEPGAECASTS